MEVININQNQDTLSKTGNNVSYSRLITNLSINTGILISIGLLLNATTGVSLAQAVNSTHLLKQIDIYSTPENDAALGEQYPAREGRGLRSLRQLTDISQLKDVSSTDWSYEALRSLVERYGCIVGFSDQTFRGNQSLTRYEFAAGLNACLNQIERLLTDSQTISAEDLTKLERLSQEFQAELESLSQRLEEIKTRTDLLQEQQFSTTTKLTGESVFNIAHIFTGENANGQEIESEPVFGNRSRLAFNTSFTGKDLLFTQFTAGNFPFFSNNLGTFEGDLGLIADNGNNLNLLAAFYSFPLSDRTTIVLEGSGGIAFDFADTINPLDQFNDSATGAISAFGVRNPIYNQVSGAGIGIRSQISDKIELSAGYLAPDAANPNQANGLFNGAYSALGQLVFKPSDRLKLGLTYINAYNKSDTFTGSNLSNFNSFVENTIGETVPISSNSYGVAVAFSTSDRFTITGWGGYTTNRVLESVTGDNGISISRGDQDIWNWAVALAFPDLLKEGNLAGVVIGMEPKVTDSNINR
ncbi:S-layer OprB family carbohydrate-selective porin [Chondrocystis sp. NIES-4102]|nr:S-layer OprB family carbohydrate-selective porin [Chondrocystis sp. NIES-4102]